MSEEATTKKEPLPALRQTISSKLLRPRPMELGKIKIGGKSPEKREKKSGKGTWQAPVKYDHFVVTGRKVGEDGNFIPDDQIHEKLGPSPEHLDIRLMFDTTEQNFQSSMVVYKGKRKVWACDGETALNLAKGTTGTCMRDSEDGCPCKPTGRLAVILEAAPFFGGFYLFRTSSWESINNLQTTLRILEAQFGSLRGLPLRLVVFPATDTYTKDDGGTGISNSWKVGVVLNADWAEARTAALAFHQADQIERHELKLLAAGVFEEVEDEEKTEGKDIAEEFGLDPEHRQEMERAEANGEGRAATEENLQRLRDQMEESRSRVVEDGAQQSEEPPEKQEIEVGDLPSFDTAAMDPIQDAEVVEDGKEEPEPLDVLSLPVQFGKYQKKGWTWGEALREDPSAVGYIKHWVLETGTHASLTPEVKAALGAAVEAHQARKEEEATGGPENDEGGPEGEGDGAEGPQQPGGEESAVSTAYKEGQEAAEDLAKLGALSLKDSEELDVCLADGDLDGLVKVRDRLRGQLKELVDGGADPQLGF